MIVFLIFLFTHMYIEKFFKTCASGLVGYLKSIELKTIVESKLASSTFSFDSDNLYSLDNFNKPIIENNIIEDNSSFNDRLKRLQSDRNIILLNQIL